MTPGGVQRWAASRRRVEGAIPRLQVGWERREVHAPQDDEGACGRQEDRACRAACGLCGLVSGQRICGGGEGHKRAEGCGREGGEGQGKVRRWGTVRASDFDTGAPSLRGQGSPGPILFGRAPWMHVLRRRCHAYCFTSRPVTWTMLRGLRETSPSVRLRRIASQSPRGLPGLMSQPPPSVSRLERATPG